MYLLETNINAMDAIKALQTLIPHLGTYDMQLKQPDYTGTV